MPDSALYCYNRALQVLEENGDYDDRTHLLTSIAVLYANTSRLDEAAAYARRAMDAAAHSDDIDMVFYAATTAGAIFQLQGKNEEAARMLRPAVDKARSQQKPMFELKGLVYLIKCFADMGQTDSLDYYMAQAELVKKRLPETANEVLGYEETHYQLLTRLGRYRESLAVQQKLFALREVNAQTPLDRLYRDMAANYEGLKDYARAARYYEKAYLAADSLHLEQVNADLSEWSVKYETQEKELEIAHLTQEQLKQEAGPGNGWWSHRCCCSCSCAGYCIIFCGASASARKRNSGWHSVTSKAWSASGRAWPRSCMTACATTFSA